MIKYKADMERLSFAGFFLAHAVWSISEGDNLITILALQRTDGTKSLVRFVDQGAESVVHAMEQLEQARDWQMAIIIASAQSFAGPTPESTALRARLFDKAQRQGPLDLLIPYRQTLTTGLTFAVGPAVAEQGSIDSSSLQEILLDGAAKHQPGYREWKAARECWDDAVRP